MPRVYFEQAALLRLARLMLPHERDFEAVLERAGREPHALCTELSQQGQTIFVTDHVVSRAFGWVLLCAELVKRRLAVPWASRPAEEWIDLLLEAAQLRGPSVSSGSGASIAMRLRSGNEEDEDDAESRGAGEVVDAFIAEVVAEGQVVFLLMSEGPERDLLCPLARSTWEAAAYPFCEGPDGYGLVRLLQPEASERHGELH